MCFNLYYLKNLHKNLKVMSSMFIAHCEASIRHHTCFILIMAISKSLEVHQKHNSSSKKIKQKFTLLRAHSNAPEMTKKTPNSLSNWLLTTKKMLNTSC